MVVPSIVSILVFVDLALEGLHKSKTTCVYIGFNPCFRGSGSRRYLLGALIHLLSRFNPCFRGSGSRRMTAQANLASAIAVSILVFVDLALEGRLRLQALQRNYVSILVFVDLALEDLERSC